MFNFLDAIPVVGHVKGAIHYVAGDVEAGNRAMMQSTRSTAVLGAGAVGFAAGPVGSAALGASVGALWDCAESVATDKPQGLMKDIDNIVETASKGEVPVAGVLQTVITVGGDALGGMGGGSMASSMSKAAGQSAAKSVGKSVGKSTGEQILKSASVPAGETFGKSVAQSAGKSAAQSAGKSVAQSAGKSAAQSAGKSVAQSAGKAAAQSAGKSVAQSAGKAAAQSAGKSVAQSAGKAAAQSAGKSVAQSVGKAVAIEVAEDVAEVIVTQTLIKTAKENIDNIQSTIEGLKTRPPANGSTGGSAGATSSGSSGGQATTSSGGSGKPPEKNPDKTCSRTLELEGSPWNEFFEIFNVRSLGQITIEGRRLFDGLEDHQVAYLEKLLQELLSKNLLGTAVRIVLGIFRNMGIEDVNFLNFISLAEFVMRYLEEHMKRLQEQQNNRPGTFPAVIDNVITNIKNNLDRHISDILKLFNEIKSQIERQTLLIDFRDICCAVYHYFKHRIIGTRTLNVPDYYDLINTNLTIIIPTREYQNLRNHGRPPVRYVRYYQAYGTRFLIVIKVQEGRIVLCTAYFFDKPTYGDREGDKYINKRKM